MLRTFLLSALLITLAPTFAASTDPDKSSFYDKPLRVRHVPLPLPSSGERKPMVTCYYYPRLMIKEVDLGELGAEEDTSTYIPKGQPDPLCRREKAKDETVMSSSGYYFEGVKDNYAVFSFPDGANGAFGFCILGTGGEKLLGFAAAVIRSVELLLPAEDPDARPWHENPVVLRYQTAYLAPCSLRLDESKCWEIIKRATGLAGDAAPDCKASYSKAEEDSRSRGADPNDVKTDPSVLKYEVEVVLDEHGVIRQAPISPVEACYPAD